MLRSHSRFKTLHVTGNALGETRYCMQRVVGRVADAMRGSTLG
ncbi:hypothetical protein [Xanthomonas arboricola]|nr:hypothetical protein [Xanthomonas arboricola]